MNQRVGSRPFAKAKRPRFSYCVYGLTLLSDIELQLPGQSGKGLGEIEICLSDSVALRKTVGQCDLTDRSDFYHYTHLADGSTYVRWDGVGEFLVSSGGTRITCSADQGPHSESFQVYLLGQALSFALIKRGFEPLHATAVEIDGQAIAFLGPGGTGKSTLAACFVQAGNRMLTDDLLILQEGDRGLVAYPGPARIKLLPQVAAQFLPGVARTGARMNPGTEKLIIPLAASQVVQGPIPLHAIYNLACLTDQDQSPTITIERLNGRDGFFPLIANTFNSMIVDSERLSRQAREAAAILKSTPISRLSYRNGMDTLTNVRAALISDLSSTGGHLYADVTS